MKKWLMVLLFLMLESGHSIVAQEQYVPDARMAHQEDLDSEERHELDVFIASNNWDFLRDNTHQLWYVVHAPGKMGKLITDEQYLLLELLVHYWARAVEKCDADAMRAIVATGLLPTAYCEDFGEQNAIHMPGMIDALLLAQSSQGAASQPCAGKMVSVLFEFGWIKPDGVLLIGKNANTLLQVALGNRIQSEWQTNSTYRYLGAR